MDQPRKDWGQCSKRFLWFSSGGLVHKGLDLALEAFKSLPECHLVICAPVEREKDFVAAYYEELYETPNITTLGWVDIESEQFRELANSCVAMIHLSCSEGGAPSIKTCMHAGLIPIVSYESGVDMHDFGFCLTDCSINNIKDIINHVSTLSYEKLEERTSKAWQFARQNYTRENFSIEYKKVILEIIEAVNAKESGRVSS
jgi:glycosyltransferase involved in cell wall biosynthesis